MVLTEEDIKRLKDTSFSVPRYEPHINLCEVGMSGQKKISESSVLVVGAGGLGCPVLLYIVAAGIGKIGIIDEDCISHSNLQRQTLYGTEDINFSKVDIAKIKLSELADLRYQKIERCKRR